jgi:hypothetical protein
VAKLEYIMVEVGISNRVPQLVVISFCGRGNKLLMNVVCSAPLYLNPYRSCEISQWGLSYRVSKLEE